MEDERKYIGFKKRFAGFVIPCVPAVRKLQEADRCENNKKYSSLPHCFCRNYCPSPDALKSFSGERFHDIE